MSTAIQESSLLRSLYGHGGESTERFAFRSPEPDFGGPVEPTIRYTTSFKSTPREQKDRTRVLRRIKGFLMDMRGKNARVAFVENDKVIPYDLPSEQLEKSGIRTVNQPFQMDEIEFQSEDGLIVGYRFRPLAKESDVYVETLNFDEERKRKRDLIIKKFSKAKA